MASERCFCYGCDCEVCASQLPDLELECPHCGSSCLERLGVRETLPETLPLPEEPSAELEASPSSEAVSLRLAPSWLRPTAGSSSFVVPPTLRQLQQLPGARRRHQGQIGAAPPVDAEGARHVGVICDGCQVRDFSGVRYRCLRCRDFDLCAGCHAQRGSLHPSHPFEAISTPRLPFSSTVANFVTSAASRSVIAIIEIGLEDSLTEARSGLDDSFVAWWLADDCRLVSVDVVAAEDPGWCCPICSDGLEAEGVSGWVVSICGGEGACVENGAVEQSASRSEDDLTGAVEENDVAASCLSAPQVEESDATEVEAAEEQAAACLPPPPSDGGVVCKVQQGHIYHEACLRRWLLKRNSCPVCRRSPVVPQF